MAASIMTRGTRDGGELIDGGQIAADGEVVLAVVDGLAGVVDLLAEAGDEALPELPL